MKKFTPKEKDEVLNRFYNGNVGSYNPIIEIIEILVSDGYVILHTSVNGSAYHITDKGKGFFLQGGYTKQEKKKWKTSTINWIMALVIAAASSIITVIVTKLLS